MKITINKPTPLFEFLIEHFSGSPRTRIKKILQNGCVYVNNQITTLHSFRLKAGDMVEINTQAGTLAKASLPFPVLYEDPNLIVIEKPAGIVTSSTDESTSVQWIITQFLKAKAKPPAIKRKAKAKERQELT